MRGELHQIADRADHVRGGEIADAPVQVQSKLPGQHLLGSSSPSTTQRSLSRARYSSWASPPKTCQSISTLLSAGTSMGVGGVACWSDRQNAHRQRMFHCVDPGAGLEPDELLPGLGRQADLLDAHDSAPLETWERSFQK